MWIVRLALSRPRTIAVMAILIALLGVLSITRTPTDILPAINTPVVNVVWSYPGLSPVEMEGRVVRLSEAVLTTAVGNVSRVESQSLPGVGIEKVYFQPGTDLAEAIAEISAAMGSLLRTMPPGITPPIIRPADASSVPIVQLAMSSDTLPIAQIYDLAVNTVLFPLITVQGSTLTPPFGGVNRLINVDLDPQAMTAKGVTAQDLTTALSNQNLILPAGTAKMGTREYVVRLNNSPTMVNSLNDLPVKTVNGATVLVRDVAHVRDGSAIQTNVVRVDGKPAVLLSILKNGDASTLTVVNAVKARLPRIRATLPENVKLDLLLDQSVFVRAAVSGVVREAVIAACLTGLMILLFLGSWRSTLIVAISIPLSILASLVVLGALGQTLNTLTLGGLALAVGMLVDDATVEVENTTRNLGLGLPLRRAILTSAQQVALPALTSTLSICIVFVPVTLLTGVAKFLFLPLALAVVFAMLPSYLLSRTLVTTMMQALLGKELHLYQGGGEGVPGAERPVPGGTGRIGTSGQRASDSATAERGTRHAAPGTPRSGSLLWRVHKKFEARFEAVRERYRGALEWVLQHRALAGGVLLLFFGVSACLLPFIGQDFFPAVDAGQMRLHVRAPAGTRIEETAPLFSEIEDTIREVIPAREIALIMDNIGLPGTAVNLALFNNGTISAADGEIDISLTPQAGSTFATMSKLRKVLNARYPDCTFYFMPADIETQVLDFGTSAPIDIQVLGPYASKAKNYALAQQIQKQVSQVAGVVDTYIYQVPDAPELRLNVDRVLASQVGLTQQSVAGNVLVSLSSSSLVSPSFYLDPKTGIQYSVQVQTPQYRVTSMDALLATPVSSTDPSQGQSTSQLLANLASTGRDTTPAIVSHIDTQPAFDVFASVQNRDLGGAAADIRPILTAMQKQAPRGTFLSLSGQVQTMQSSFLQMGVGLIFAVILIYLLLTVNFESWVDPLVILMASPGALSGVLWMLYVTQTTFNVPSLMGTIMCIGVATANSILLVTFANDQRLEGKNALEAALAAGYTRFRPVIMTALAMILGMLPMSLGLGEGGEQNAPLGRAVIGGLGVATCTTLFFVPLMYTILRRKQPVPVDASEDDAVSAPSAISQDGRAGSPA
jgi:multidrug efflux pump subunit AcrB